MKTIRILLADDNAEFLSLVGDFLSGLKQHGFEVVAAATSGAEAIEQTFRLSPDVVLLDLAMPGINGIETARRITAEANSPAVIMLTLHGGLEYREAAREAGAVGFVAKQTMRAELTPCILSCLGNCCLLPKGIPRQQPPTTESHEND